MTFRCTAAVVAYINGKQLQYTSYDGGGLLMGDRRIVEVSKDKVRAQDLEEYSLHYRWLPPSFASQMFFWIINKTALRMFDAMNMYAFWGPHAAFFQNILDIVLKSAYKYSQYTITTTR